MVIKAVCVFTALTRLSGTIFLTQNERGSPTEISGTIRGLTPGEHGMHIHQYGDISNPCKNIGGHFNPYNKDHSAPDNPNGHMGDVGNVVADSSGTGTFSVSNFKIQLYGPLTVIGRSFAVHERSDDYGRGPSEDSRRFGNGGPHIGCCTIGFSKSKMGGPDD